MELLTKSELAERAWLLNEGIKKCLVNIRDNYLALGCYAFELKHDKLYRLLDPDARTWEIFVSRQNWGLKRGSLDNYADVSVMIGEYLTGRDIDLNRALDITRIVRALPAPEREDKARELIGSAEIMPPAAWKDTIRECKGMITSEECDHPEEFRKHKELCTKCGGWLS